MIAPQRVPNDGDERTGAASRKLAVSDPRALDRVKRAASIGYRTIPAKRAVVGRAVNRDERTVSDWCNGRHSPLSHAGAAVFLAVSELAVDGHALEAANLVSSMCEATLKAIAMWPIYSPLPTHELVRIRDLLYAMETQINGELNDLQMARAMGARVDVERELMLWTAQATYSERGMALLHILADRPDYLG